MSDIDNINEAALTVRRTFYTILVYAAFCLVVLGLDFRAFNDFEGKIQIPLINAEMDWATFMILGPLILIALMAYLHVFLGYWLQAPHELRTKGVPTLFSIDNQVAEIISLLIFYGVPPLVLAHFALAGVVQSASIESQPQSVARWFPMVAFLLTLLMTVLLFLRRVKCHLPVRKTSLAIVPVVFVSVLAFQFSALPFNPFMSYQVNIEHVQPTSAELETSGAPDVARERVSPEVTEEPPMAVPPGAAAVPLEPDVVAVRPKPVTNHVSSDKIIPKILAYSFYGIASGGSWSERHFKNITPGKAISDVPRIGDYIQATSDVNARAGYIRYSLGKGWVNEKILSVIKRQELFTVLEVNEVVPGFYWVKIDLAEREASVVK